MKYPDKKVFIDDYSSFTHFDLDYSIKLYKTHLPNSALYTYTQTHE